LAVSAANSSAGEFYTQSNGTDTYRSYTAEMCVLLV